jgi:hypothetical protein
VIRTKAQKERAERDSLRAKRKAQAKQRPDTAAERCAAVSRALAKSRDFEKDRLRRIIEWASHSPMPPWAVSSDAEKSKAFLDSLRGVCPKLLDERYVKGLHYLGMLPHLRPVSEWSPRGKSLDSLFRSLAEHMIGKYRVGAVLWSGLLGDNAPTFSLAVSHVAGGGSFFKFIKDGGLPVPLTQKQCHDVLATSSDYSLFDAIRRAIVRSSGGDGQLFSVLKATPWGRQFMGHSDEEFWLTVVAWFGKNPMMDRTLVGPLADYIEYRRRQEPDFSMKGRSALAMIRGMQEWHGELATMKKIRGMEFKPSGFRGGEYEVDVRERGGPTRRQTWRVFEILSSKELAEEGRRMHHCVWSYAHRIESGHVSIWSMTKEDSIGNWAQLTIEVANQPRKIVQYRGVCNRVANADEVQILSRWASTNGLEISSINGW